MNKSIFTIGLLSALFFVGCTGFDHDPLKGKPAPIQNAKPPDNKPSPERPFPVDSVKIVNADGVDLAGEIVTYQEGETQTIPLKVKSYLSGYSYTLTALNLEEFKGAVFDSKTGQFTWTPEVGIVTNAAGIEKFILSVWLVAAPNDSTVGKATLSGSLDLHIWVQNRASRPVVKKIEYAPGSPNQVFFEEGTSRNLVVTVEDLKSPAGGTTKAVLKFEGKLGEYTRVTSTPRPIPNTKTWNFNIRIDLVGADLTKSVTDASLQVFAVNAEGQTSVPYPSLDFTILTQFGAPRTTFPLYHELKSGVENVVPFIIYDSNHEAVLTVVDHVNLPFGAQVTCETVRRPFQQCVFVWTPSANDEGRLLRTDLKIEMRNMSPIDMRVVQVNESIYYKVIAP